MGLKSSSALKYFISLCKQNNINRILDIGAGSQVHTKSMRKEGLNVETNDILPSMDHYCLYQDLIDFQGFDGIWASHVLEHQINPGIFLAQIHNDLHENGILAITVPPRKDEIVGGHVTLWNAGILLYNLILAGFNCKNASVLTYGYNISVILKKESITLPDLKYGSGDIETLAEFFPKGLKVKQNFNGNIVKHNWNFKE